MTLKAFDSMGQEVRAGETILGHRNQKAEFLRPTLARTPGKSGKIFIRWPGPDGHTGEYYDRTFDLHVKEVENDRTTSS